MLTREQKKNQIEESKQAIKESHCLVLVDFSGASVSEMRGLRLLLREFDARMQVVKKRLLKIALKDSGNVLPGHGGFLDRFDGVFISAPFVFAFLKMMGYI